MKGVEIKFTNRCLNWYRENAFDVCQVSGNITSAEDYFVFKAIGERLPYKAILTGKLGFDDCKHVKVKVGKTTSDFYIDKKDFKVVKTPKRKKSRKK